METLTNNEALMENYISIYQCKNCSYFDDVNLSQFELPVKSFFSERQKNDYLTLIGEGANEFDSDPAHTYLQDAVFAYIAKELEDDDAYGMLQDSFVIQID